MNTLFENCFKGKTVLVTGHTGFKGSWLSIWLKELGAKVIGYGLDPYSQEDNFVVTKLKEKIVDIRGDIRDMDKLYQVFRKYKPHIVFHLAAQPLVRLSYKIPKETYEVNVIGTLNVLECIRKSHFVKVGVMITTDKCYENNEQIWGYRETDAMGGYDPYSSSKGCAELLIASYRNSFMNPKEYLQHGKAISSVRAGNVIGGGDWQKDRIIPDCIRALIDNTPIKIRNPKATRPFQHVLEPLSGYLLLASKMYEDGVNYSGAWNFGPDYNSIVNVETIVNLMISKWGCGQWIDLSNKNQPHEAKLLSLDCTKAKTYLNWRPRLDMEEAIEYTVDWYKNYKTSNVYDLCLNQIKEYSK
ncbi:CDP-glucose 4,6-dehydratase [Oceanirhabdus seepicola]|uniref:CDP-glucose 4,6-dehydratase n=1 Tax=Oceanirhabdus seepicola TaxID=2828781 RepID=A0A9J6NXX8_9CLOT|nr:CDP-glucose 4,6-dehydratase [Oceanirhabdus seepicola]MCM1989306.1 CDP-glucose 4,6-dehydratase [Oceanirhabdus seepicola]